MIGSVSPKRILAVVALAVLGVVGAHLPALALSGAVAVVLTGLSLWEYEPFRARFRARRQLRNGEDSDQPAG